MAAENCTCPLMTLQLLRLLIDDFATIALAGWWLCNHCTYRLMTLQPLIATIALAGWWLCKVDDFATIALADWWLYSLMTLQIDDFADWWLCRLVTLQIVDFATIVLADWWLWGQVQEHASLETSPDREERVHRWEVENATSAPPQPLLNNTSTIPQHSHPPTPGNNIQTTPWPTPQHWLSKIVSGTSCCSDSACSGALQSLVGEVQSVVWTVPAVDLCRALLERFSLQTSCFAGLIGDMVMWWV